MVVIYFGAIVSLLYYFNIIQRLIRVLGGIMAVIMAISPAEAFVAAANIFVGPVSPYLSYLHQAVVNYVYRRLLYFVDKLLWKGQL